MPITDLTLRLLLLFFPGIVFTYVIDLLTVHGARRPFFFLVLSFVWGLGSYVVYGLILQLLPRLGLDIDGTVFFLQSLSASGVPVRFAEIARVTFVAVLLGLGATACITHNLLHKTAHRLALTRKFGDHNVWSFLFNSPTVRWVTVRDQKSDLAFEGWVLAYSDDAEKPELLLREVTVHRNSTGEVLYRVAGVYLASLLRDASIELKASEETA